MDKISYQNVKFMLSVAKLSQLPADAGSEIAFVGRSNCGKSSTLNALTQQKHLAQISKTPGRTQHLNFFEVNPEYRLVDLPGYGYAKVSLPVKERWQKLMAEYLHQRQSLRGLVLILDIRHLGQLSDLHMIEWAAQQNLPLHILLNKADKLAKYRQQAAVIALKKLVEQHCPNFEFSLQVFSAAKKTGVSELRAKLQTWVESEAQSAI